MTERVLSQGFWNGGVGHEIAAPIQETGKVDGVLEMVTKRGCWGITFAAWPAWVVARCGPVIVRSLLPDAISAQFEPFLVVPGAMLSWRQREFLSGGGDSPRMHVRLIPALSLTAVGGDIGGAGDRSVAGCRREPGSADNASSPPPSLPYAFCSTQAAPKSSLS